MLCDPGKHEVTGVDSMKAKDPAYQMSTGEQAVTEFDAIADLLIAHYGKRDILSILAYGTRVSNTALVDLYSDYDITVVFRHYPNKVLPPLPRRADVTVMFWPDIELCGVEHFRLRNHGEFYIYVLAQAVVLYGINPFVDLIQSLSEERIVESLLEQLLLHSSKLASIALLPLSEYRTRSIRKYSFRIAQNFHFLQRREVDYRPFRDTAYCDWLDIFGSSATVPKLALDFLFGLRQADRSAPTPNAVLQFIHLIKSNAICL